jgi:hypothetical protein
MILAGFAATLVSAAAHGGTVIYVDDDAPPPGDGLGWATAYPSLQDALAEAGASGGAVTEIHVAQGVYTPAPGGVSTCCTPHGGMGCDDAGCEVLVCAALPLCCAVSWDAACAAAAADLCGGLCADARTATFQLVDGVALRGGYAGIGEPDPSARDTALYETVLSGDLAGNDGPGDFENNEENSYNVVTASGTGLTAVLDGFTVSGGNADGLDTDPLSWRRGAGIWNLTGSPTVTDCVITANSADLGGGMYNRTNSHPEIQDCHFTGNSAMYGGGMYNWQNCHPLVTNCTFQGNITEEGGGMTNLNFSSPTVENCTFVSNVGRYGAGMENVNGCSPVVTDCLFLDNQSFPDDGWGGGMVNYQDCDPVITGCTFSDNFARDGGGLQSSNNSHPIIVNSAFTANEAVWGGGVEVFDNSSTLLINCLISENTASGGGGGVITANNCVVDVVNCTVLYNTTTGIGGGIWVSDAYGGHSENTVSNSIVRGNVPEQILAEAGATATVSYSNIEGGYPGAGNIDTDPLFADADGRLGPGSPCIDAADNSAVPPDSDDLDDDGDVSEPVPYDLDGNPRFVDDPCREDTGLGDPPIVDMGAYEFQDRSCDLDGSGDVGVTDFLALLAAWGPCPAPCPPSCPADFDGDCEVGVTDFLILLANWG